MPWDNSRLLSRLPYYPAKMNIKWKFNLSRAPWWGEQFEGMVGINKSVANGILTWAELHEVLLDSRPPSYVEEDMQLPLSAAQ